MDGQVGGAVPPGGGGGGGGGAHPGGGGGGGGGAPPAPGGGGQPQVARNLTRHLPGITIKTFTGHKSDDIESWLNRFDGLCAAINLDDDAKRQVIPFYLHEGAETIVRQLLAERAHAIEAHNNAAVPGAVAPQEVTYGEIRDLLRRTFAGPHADRNHRREFHKRRQENGETVRHYGLALQELVTKAYPRLPPPEQQAEALDRFLQGLHDKYRSQLALREYDNLMDAVREAEVLESIEEDRRPSRAVAATVSTLTAPVKEDRSVEFQHVKQALDEIHSRMVGDPNTAPRPPPVEATCYLCGEKGHFKRDCPNQRSVRQDSQPPSRRRRVEDGFSTLREVRCYECSGVGHIARDCANVRSPRPRMTGGNAETQRGNDSDSRRYRDRGDSREWRQGRSARYEERRESPRRYEERRQREYSEDRRYRSQERDRGYPQRTRRDSREPQRNTYRGEPKPEGGYDPRMSRQEPHQSHAANALYEPVPRSGMKATGETAPFPIPAQGAWGVREGNQVTFKVGNGPQVNSITANPRLLTTGNKIHLLMLMAVVFALPGSSSGMGTNPLLCEAARGGFSWRVPETYECSVSAKDFSAAPVYQTMEMYSQNVWLYKSKAFLCTKYRHVFMQKNWLFRDNRATNETVLKVPVAEEECRKWVKTKVTEWGPLRQSQAHPEVWAVSQPLDRTWGRFMIDCCRWLTTEAWGASVHETQVSSRHGDPFPVSPLADMTHCGYQDGRCPLPSGEIVFWTPNGTEDCSLKPWQTLNGTRHKSLWISQDENFAFSFRQTRGKKVKCKEYLSLTDQGVWVKEGPRQEKRSTSFDIAMKNIVEEMKGPQREKRAVSEKEEDKMSVVSDRMLASRLQAMSWYVDRTLQAAFLVNAKAVCSLAKATFINTRAQLMINPTPIVRQLLGHQALVATFAGGVVQASPCVELPKGAFFFRRPKACYGAAVPITYQVAGRNHTGFMDVVTNVVSGKADRTSCEGGRAHYVELRNASFWLLSDGRQVPGNRSRLPRLPALLHPFNLTLHYNHTTFTNFLMYDMDIFRPAVSVTEYLAAEQGTKEVAHLLRIQRDKDNWEKKNNQLEFPAGLFSWPHVSMAQVIGGIIAVIMIVVACAYCQKGGWPCGRPAGGRRTGYREVCDEETPRRPSRPWRRGRRLPTDTGLRLRSNPINDTEASVEIDSDPQGMQVQLQHTVRRRLENWADNSPPSPDEEGELEAETSEAWEGVSEVEERNDSPQLPRVAMVHPLTPWIPRITVIPPSASGSREDIHQDGTSADGRGAPVPADSARRARRNTQHSSVNITALERLDGAVNGMLPFLDVHFRGMNIDMVWDTGATHSFITSYLADEILTHQVPGEGILVEETTIIPPIFMTTCTGRLVVRRCIETPLRLGREGPRVWARLYIIPRDSCPKGGIIGQDIQRRVSPVTIDYDQQTITMMLFRGPLHFMPPASDPMAPFSMPRRHLPPTPGQNGSQSIEEGTSQGDGDQTVPRSPSYSPPVSPDEDAEVPRVEEANVTYRQGETLPGILVNFNGIRTIGLIDTACTTSLVSEDLVEGRLWPNVGWRAQEKPAQNVTIHTLAGPLQPMTWVEASLELETPIPTGGNTAPAIKVSTQCLKIPASSSPFSLILGQDVWKQLGPHTFDWDARVLTFGEKGTELARHEIPMVAYLPLAQKSQSVGTPGREYPQVVSGRSQWPMGKLNTAFPAPPALVPPGLLDAQRIWNAVQQRNWRPTSGLVGTLRWGSPPPQTPPPWLSPGSPFQAHPQWPMPPRQAYNNLIFTADDTIDAVIVKFRGRYIRAVVDTGSTVSLVSGQLLRLYEELAVDDTIFQRQRADLMIHTVVGSVTVRSQLEERLQFGTPQSYMEVSLRLYEIPEAYCQFDILLGLDWWTQMGNPTMDRERRTLTLPGWPPLPLRLIPFQPALYIPGTAERDLPDPQSNAVRFAQRLGLDPDPPDEPLRGFRVDDGPAPLPALTNIILEDNIPGAGQLIRITLYFRTAPLIFLIDTGSSVSILSMAALRFIMQTGPEAEGLQMQRYEHPRWAATMAGRFPLSGVVDGEANLSAPGSAGPIFRLRLQIAPNDQFHYGWHGVLGTDNLRQIGNLTVDWARQVLRIAGAEVPMTPGDAHLPLQYAEPVFPRPDLRLRRPPLPRTPPPGVFRWPRARTATRRRTAVPGAGPPAVAGGEARDPTESIATPNLAHQTENVPAGNAGPNRGGGEQPLLLHSNSSMQCGQGPKTKNTTKKKKSGETTSCRPFSDKQSPNPPEDDDDMPGTSGCGVAGANPTTMSPPKQGEPITTSSSHPEMDNEGKETSGKDDILGAQVNHINSLLQLKGADLPLIDVTVNGITLPFLYDTGASISIVPFKTFAVLGIPPSDSWPVLEPIGALSGTITGTHRFRCEVIMGTLHLGIKEFLVVHDSACRFNGILGNDLTGNAGDITLNMTQGYLKIQQTSVPIKVVNNVHLNAPPIKVRCYVDTELPAGTAKKVLARLDPGVGRMLPPQAEAWCCEPALAALAPSGLFIRPTVVPTGTTTIPLFVENYSRFPAKLYANQTMAIAEEPSLLLEPKGSEKHQDPYVILPPEATKEVNALPAAKTLTREELMGLFKWDEVAVTPEERLRLQDLIWEYRAAFARDSYDLGKCGIIKLEIDTGDNPPLRTRPNRVPEALKQEVKDQLTKMEACGVIRSSCSPWASNMVLVKKPDGSLRCCIDYRRLNAVTRRDCYPLPVIDELLDSLGNARYLSTLDLAAGYWQIQLSDDAQPKTAFNSQYGLYEFTVASFGLMNLPSQFQRVMDHVFAGLLHESVLIYLDDVIVYSATLDQHLADLAVVLRRLQQFNLKAKPSKVSLCREEVNFLGFKVSREGLHTNEDKIKAMVEMESPVDLRTLQAGLGTINFYRRFIKGYSQIAAPLYKLLGKEATWEWNESHEKAFRALIQRLVEAPILALPKFNEHFVLTTDASNYAIGAVLAQERNGREQPVAYWSRTMNKAEKNYSITEKECLAAVMAIKHFKEYLFGREFTLVTDHSPLKSILSASAEGNARLQRWALLLQQYQYTVKYKRGSTNIADGLSRLAKGSVNALTARVRPDSDLPLREQRVRFEAGEAVDGVTDQAGDGYILVNQEFKRAQRADPWLQSVIVYLESSELPEDGAEAGKVKDAAEKYELGLGNCLYAVQPNPGTSRKPLVVPQALVHKLLLEHHEGFGGHLGLARTLYRIRRTFFWPTMYRDTKQLVDTCMVCQQTKSPLRIPRAPMVPWMPAEPFQRLYLDILGPLSETKRGNRFIVCFQDAATAWPEAFAVPDTKGPRIAEIMVNEIFCRYGAPSVLCSDQGRNLLAKVVNDVNDIFNVRRLTTAGYRPETMGQIEVTNRVMGSMLRAFCQKNPSDWDQYLAAALLALRSSVQDSRGESPAFLTFGRDLVYPTEALQTPRPRGYREMEDYRADLVLALNDANRLATEMLVKTQHRNKRNFDQKIYGTEYTVGQRVWLEKPGSAAPKGTSRKLWIKREGPYRIVNLKLYPNAEIVPVDAPRTKPRLVHVARLSPCYSPHVIGRAPSPDAEEREAPEDPPRPDTRTEVELLFPPTWLAHRLEDEEEVAPGQPRLAPAAVPPANPPQAVVAPGPAIVAPPGPQPMPMQGVPAPGVPPAQPVLPQNPEQAARFDEEEDIREGDEAGPEGVIEEVADEDVADEDVTAQGGMAAGEEAMPTGGPFGLEREASDEEEPAAPFRDLDQSLASNNSRRNYTTPPSSPTPQHEEPGTSRPIHTPVNKKVQRQSQAQAQQRSGRGYSFRKREHRSYKE